RSDLGVRRGCGVRTRQQGHSPRVLRSSVQFISAARPPSTRGSDQRTYTDNVTSNSAVSHPHSFASDNWAGIHPEVLDAIGAANVGDARAYGGDAWTLEFEALART